MLALLLAGWPVWAGDFPVRRCINLADALDSPMVEGEWGPVIEPAHLDAIAAAGFDAVRLPVRFSSRWNGTRIDAAFLARVDAVIRMGLDRGLTVILDLHHFEDLMRAPDRHADSFAGIWAVLAAHYAGWPDGLVFELLNEPSEAVDTPTAVALYARVWPVLRRHHPDRWVVVSGADWGNLAELAGVPVFDDRTVLTFHSYSPWEFTHQTAPWFDPPLPARTWGSPADRSRVTHDMARAVRDARGAPLFLGEFGAHRDMGARRHDWLRTVRQAAEAQGIGWCVWSFASTFAIYDTDRGAWMPGALDSLLDGQAVGGPARAQGPRDPGGAAP